MSGVSIMDKQVGGACHAGRMIGLSHSGTRLVLPNPADNLIVNPGFEQGLTGWKKIGTGTVLTPSISSSSINTPHSGNAWYRGDSDNGGVSQTVAVSPGSRYRLDFWHAVGEGNSWRTATATVTAGDAVVASAKTPNRAVIRNGMKSLSTSACPRTARPLPSPSPRIRGSALTT